MKGVLTMQLEIKKIEKKIKNLDVRGQGCDDDCADWSGKKAAAPAGCTCVFSKKISGLL